MGIFLASGNLTGSGTIDSSEITTAENYTGALGILLSGDFGSGSLSLLTADPTDPGGSSRSWKNWSPLNAFRSDLIFSTVGLYHRDRIIFDDLMLRLSSATDAALSWVLFLPPRP